MNSMETFSEAGVNVFDPVIHPAQLHTPMDWPAVFGNHAPIHVEIGSGSGHWLAETARMHPEINYLGIEKATSEVRRATDKLRRRGVRNVRLLRYDAAYILSRYVTSGGIEVFHIYFPDPWPKSRHAKRRVIRPEVAAEIARCLRPGGTLHVKTDVNAYQEQIMLVLGATRGLVLVEQCRLDSELPCVEKEKLPALLEHPDKTRLPEALRLTTNYERKALTAGRPDHYTRWVRADEA
jgi:tRNA (guanine-N(7)-)-methyltransferase